MPGTNNVISDNDNMEEKGGEDFSAEICTPHKASH